MDEVLVFDLKERSPPAHGKRWRWTGAGLSLISFRQLEEKTNRSTSVNIGREDGIKPTASFIHAA